MRIERKQTDRFTTESNAAATTNKPEGLTRAKKQTTSEKDRCLKALKTQFRIRLTSAIDKCNEGDKDFDGLRNKLLQAKRLEKGVVSDADKTFEGDSTPVATFLNNYKQKSPSVNLWKDYINDKFEDLKKAVVQSEGKDDNSDDDSSNDSSEDSDDDDEVKEDEQEESEEEEEEYQQSRTCSTNLSSIIRNDLPPNIRQTLIETIDATLIQTSNYISDFSKQVLKVALLFNDHEFLKQDRGITLVPQEGNSLQPVLPDGYLAHTVHVPKPLNANCLKDAGFCNYYLQLFQEPHLELIHSCYYGAKGAQDTSLEELPLQKEILKVLPRDDLKPYASLSSLVMRIARCQYETNFQNMWADNTIVNKLLARLLQYLLLIHLCPDSDGEFKAKKEEYQDKIKGKGKQVLRDTNGSIPFESISLINKTRNGRRRLFNKERQQMEKYLKKGNTKAAERCQVRLDTYAEVLKRERQERDMRQERDKRKEGDQKRPEQYFHGDDMEDELIKDDIKTEKSKDISKRRLNKLVQLTRSALFREQDITPDIIHDKKFKNVAEEELNVIIKIVHFVKPYIPSKANYRSFAYQLPFVLMANQVLRSIGRESRTVKITPIVNPHPYMPCGNHIPVKSALSHKDAVFGSFFDMAKIQSIAKDYGMQFNNLMYILPGTKTVRINGTYLNMRTVAKTAEPSRAKTRALRDDEENDDKKDEDDATLDRLKAQQQVWQKRLVDSTKKLYAHIQQNGSVTSQRKQWKQNVQARHEIGPRRDALKMKTRELMTHVRDAKEQLQDCKRAIYQHHHPDTAPATNPISINEHPNLNKAEDCHLAESVNLTEAIFAGTDNGIVKTTETVFFDIDRFLVHLELYRDFQMKDDPMEIDDAVPKKCLTLPKAHTVAASQIAERTGLTTYTSNMLNMKKRTRAGHQAMEAEDHLRHHSLQQAATSDELQNNYDQHVRCRKPVRTFYHSKSMIKKKRTLELKKRQGQDRIAADERRESGYKQSIKTIGANKDKPLFMFLGDRGFGIGSSIKGHQRFGGPWKGKIHGRYTPTLITNEYNSSQTCLFCFRKLCHPLTTTTIKTKDNSKTADETQVSATNGSFVCINEKCPNAYKVVCRDQVSALAIGLAGLAQVLFGVTFPCFDEHPSRLKREKCIDSALDFLDRKQRQEPPFGNGNTL